MPQEYKAFRYRSTSIRDFSEIQKFYRKIDGLLSDAC